ncbi:hypothetical protein HDZ31DRAFT_59739 [Schizophyllum fasciatum]
MSPTSLRVLALLCAIELVAGAPPATATVQPFKPDRRDIISSATEVAGSLTSEAGDALTSALPSAVQSVYSSLASAVPTEAIVGMIPGFDVPSVDDIKKKAGLSDDQIERLPVRILNIPGYANRTDNGWSVLFHGQAYRQPLDNSSKLDDLTNVFLPEKDVSELSELQQNQARNLTSAIYSLPVSNLPLTFTLYNATKGAEDSLILNLTFPLPTDSRGEFNQFVSMNNSIPADLGDRVHRIEVRTNAGELGNSSAFLVPPEGITFLADIDDILRVTRIYAPLSGLNNSFANPFTPWSNMPAVYAHWLETIPSAHFHYLTTTPEPATRMYESFIFGNYPLGSFDTRPYNFTTFDQTFRVRSVALRRALESFPNRKFVLIGDTSNADIMRDYPQLAKEYGSVQCILLRNTSATDSGDKFPYDTSGFDGLDNSTYFFFNVPDDLMGLDIENGECVNSSVTQNVQYGYQNLPTDLETDAALRMGGDMARAGILTGGLVAAMLLL